MTKENHANGDAQQSQNGHNDARPFGHLYGIIIVATWAFIALLLASLFWPNLTERTKFFTSNFWNLVIAFTVIAQVKINQQQWRSMVDGLKRTDEMIENMKEQLSATKQEAAAAIMAAETSKRALHIAERPYLHVSYLNVTPIPFQPHTPIEYQVRLKNTGRTPAYDTTGAIYIRISEERMTENPYYMPVPEHSKGTLGSELEQGWHQITPDLDLQPIDIAKIESGEFMLYVFGVVTYRDGFSADVHRLRYCYQYSATKKAMIASSCHNDST